MRLALDAAPDPPYPKGAMIVARVRRTLSERRLLEPGDGVLVGVSGGPDSVALLHVLARLAPELRLRLHAASVDHGLRPDADRDVALAAEVAERLGVPFRGLQVTVSGPSVQAAAREARYLALREEAARVGARWVAVGHTLDDQAETVLARLLRGAGVRGLAGIAPRREDGVIRPLIDCRRDEVHAHLAHHALPARRDPTNDDPAFERVRLRRHALPALAEEDPRVAEHLARLADEARALSGWLTERADDLASPAEARLDRAALLEAAGPVRRAALAGWVASVTGRSAKRAHVEALERSLLEGRGEVLLGGGWVVRADRGWVPVRDPDHPSRSHRSPAGSPE